MLGMMKRRGFLLGTAALGSVLPSGDFWIRDAKAQTGIRRRREVHDLVASDGTRDPDLIAYMDAIEATKANSPILWDTLIRFHDAFCATGAGAREVHFNWRFVMWHRAYLATYERILQEHSNQVVSLPYWNWFKSDSLPEAFTLGALSHIGRTFDGGRPLDDADRGGAEAANYDTDVAFDFGPLTSFFGQTLDPLAFNAGLPEGGAHGGIHNYIGGDMADLNRSSLDPCFYSHHSNVDRMLELWKVNSAPSDWLDDAPDDWKNQVFEFAFSNDRVYRYRAIDMVDSQSIVDLDGVNLGFEYDDVPIIGGPQPASVLAAFANSAGGSAVGEMRIAPPSQTFALGGMNIVGGTGATSEFELSDEARAVTEVFIAGSGSGAGDQLSTFSLRRSGAPSARLVLRDVVVPAKNAQISFFINVEEPGAAEIAEGSRYIGTINAIPSREGNIVYEELTFEASEEIVNAIKSDASIYISSFSRYLGESDAVSIGEVELIIQ